MKRIAQLAILLVLALTLSGCSANKDFVDIQIAMYANANDIDIQLIDVKREVTYIDNLVYYKIELKPYVSLKKGDYFFDNETVYYLFDKELIEISKYEYEGGIE